MSEPELLWEVIREGPAYTRATAVRVWRVNGLTVKIDWGMQAVARDDGRLPFRRYTPGTTPTYRWIFWYEAWVWSKQSDGWVGMVRVPEEAPVEVEVNAPPEDLRDGLIELALRLVDG